LEANTRATSSCAALSTFTPKRPASRTIGSVLASFSKQTSASSGSSDSEHSALAVIPPSPAGPALVITATPVAKRPNTSRNSSGSTVDAIAARYIAARAGALPASRWTARRPAPAILVAAVGDDRAWTSEANVS
jgi:hypothetical protein